MTTLAIKSFQRHAATTGLAGALAKAWDVFSAYRQALRERAQLLALNERELHDIGITRVDAVNAARQPLLDGFSVSSWWRQGGAP